MTVTAWILLIMFGLFALSDLNLTEDETKHIKFFIIMKQICLMNFTVLMILRKN